MNSGVKAVASAILADVEPGFQPGGTNGYSTAGFGKLQRLRGAGSISGRQDAALYGRPGGPPLLTKALGTLIERLAA